MRIVKSKQLSSTPSLMVITSSPKANKHIHQSKGFEYIPNKSKGSAMLETFLRGLANQVKNKEKGK
jgi:hypothetical protein